MPGKKSTKKNGSSKAGASKAAASAKATPPAPAPTSLLPPMPPLPRTSKTIRSHLRADTGAESDVGRTPLHCAARNGHTEVVKVLLGAGGTDVAAVDRQGRTALMDAVRHNQLEVVELMLADARGCKSANVMDADGQVPLLAAIQFGHTSIAKAFLRSKDVDVCVVGYGTMPNRHPPPAQVTVSTPVTAIDADAGSDANTGDASAAPHTKTRISLPRSSPARARTLAAPPPPSAPHAGSVAVPPPPIDVTTAAPAPPAAPHGDADGDCDGDDDYNVLDPAPYQPDLSRHMYPEGGAGLTAVTPLHLAAGLGDAEAVDALLAHPSAAAQLQQDHSLLSVFVLQTPLHLAVQAGCAAAARALLVAGHQVDVPSARLGHTALHRAVALGHLELVRLLLEFHANPLLLASVPYGENQLEHGFNALALLLHDPNPNPPGTDLAIAQLLLDSTVQSDKQRRAQAAISGDGMPYGSLVTARTGVLQRTALHLAVGTGLSMARDAQRATVLELLLDHPDTDINARDALGCTPLLLAAQQLAFCGHERIATLLTHAHIDVTRADTNLRKTALHYAAEYGGLELAKACIAVDSELLNCADAQGMTPFMLAAQAGHVALLRLMLQQSCLDANARTWQGQTALHFATVEGHGEAVSALCDAAPRVDVNAQDASHHTALHAAAMRGRVAIIDTLVATPCIDLLAGCDAAGSPVKVACASGLANAVTVYQLIEEWGRSEARLARLRPWFAWRSDGTGHALATMPLLHACAVTLQPPAKTAAQCGELVQLLTSLLECAAALTQTHNGGQSCLMEAVFQESAGMVAALMDEAYSSVEAVRALTQHRDDAGETALHMCARHGRIDMARQILRVDPALCNVPSADGLTPLMAAAQAKQVKTMLFLLMLGAPVDNSASSAALDEALQKAAKVRGSSTAATTEPAHSGAYAPVDTSASSDLQCAPQPSSVVVDVLAQCKHGRTALHYAAQTDDTASVVVLLSTLPQAPTRHCKSLSDSEHAQCAVNLWSTVSCECRVVWMQRKLWVARDADGNTAAHVALDCAAWNCLRVLASCKSADLVLRRKRSVEGCTGGSGSVMLAQELRATPVAEQAAVQAVLSQLAYDELLRGLDDEEVQSKARAEKAAKKKARKQSKVASSPSPAPTIDSESVNTGSNVAADQAVDHSPEPDETARANSQACDHAATSAALLPGELSSSADAWTDVSSKRSARERSAKATAAAQKKQNGRRGGNNNAAQQVATRRSDSGADTAAKRSTSDNGASALRTSSATESAGKGHASTQKRNGTAMHKQHPAHASAGQQHQQTTASAPALPAADSTGSELLKNSCWGERAHALPSEASQAQQAACSVPAQPAHSDFTAFAHLSAWDGCAHDAQSVHWGNSTLSPDDRACGALCTSSDAFVRSSTPVVGENEQSGRPPRPQGGKLAAGARHSESGNAVQRQASAHSAHSTDAAAPPAEVAERAGSASALAAAQLAPASAADWHSSGAAPVWQTPPSFDPAIGRRSTDAVRGANESDAAVAADATPTAPLTAVDDGWSPLTGTSSRYAEWCGRGGSPELDSDLQQEHHGTAGIHTQHDGVAAADGGESARGWQPLNPSHPAHRTQRNDAIFDQASGASTGSVHQHRSTAAAELNDCGQIWGAQATSQSRNAQEHERLPEWAAPLDGAQLPLGSLRNGKFILQ